MAKKLCNIIVMGNVDWISGKFWHLEWIYGDKILLGNEGM